MGFFREARQIREVVLCCPPEDFDLRRVADCASWTLETLSMCYCEGRMEMSSNVTFFLNRLLLVLSQNTLNGEKQRVIGSKAEGLEF